MDIGWIIIDWPPGTGLSKANIEYNMYKFLTDHRWPPEFVVCTQQQFTRICESLRQSPMVNRDFLTLNFPVAGRVKLIIVEQKRQPSIFTEGHR